MSSLPTSLAPGIGVRPWRHFFGRFDLASRIRVHPGARVHGDGIEPAVPLRGAEPAELALLDATARSGEPAIEVFSTPAILREAFASLDPDELPGPGSESTTGGWRAFAAEVAEFLAWVEAPIAKPYRLLLDVRDPRLPTPLLSGGPARLLLGGGPHAAPGEPPVTSVAAYVNIGEVPSALVFWTVAMPVMAVRLAAEGGVEPPDLPALVRDFTVRFGQFPLARLELGPGEGVFLPAGLLAHDLDPTGASDLIMSLVALPVA